MGRVARRSLPLDPRRERPGAELTVLVEDRRAGEQLATFAAHLPADHGAGLPEMHAPVDMGVHLAEQQMAAFDSTMASIPPRGWVLTLNQHLPDDVAVRAARAVPTGFTPRFQSKKKRYRYDLLLDKVRDPLLSRRTWRIGYDMDMARLERESKAIVGTHDFVAFRSAGDERTDTVRTIHNVSVTRAPMMSTEQESTSTVSLYSITIEGSAFLYNMVRILVGTLVDVARGHLEEGAIARALAEKDRSFAGQTAPAHGLTLQAIELELPTEGVGERWPR